MAKLLARIDDWVATRMFVPIIIKLCQKFDTSQYAFANYCVLIAIGTLLYDVLQRHSIFAIIFQVLVGLLATVQIVLVALFPHFKMAPSRPWRFVEASFLICNVFLNPPHWHGHLFWFMMLTANYARGINHIPPEEKKQKEAKKVSQLG